MRFVMLPAIFGLVAVPVMAQTAPPDRTLLAQAGQPFTTAPGTYPTPGAYNGARPGNAVGSGTSLPMGNRASNIDREDTRSVLAPNLPEPGLGDNARPADYLRAAQGSLAVGRTGETQQALEMAQTRLLDRSVAYGQTRDPSGNPAVAQVSQALRLLAARDRAGCMTAIQTALSLLPR